MRLPASLDDLRGLRAARWSRESTTGQFDAFGPEAQREQQDRAIERYGLIDTGLAWTVAHSGRTVGNTAHFREMLAAAGERYDVLVVGYVSRFARDLRTAVNARHDLHAAGAAILFADERILTSDEDAWDSWAREAVEAESYSRKLARRIREGYAAKRRRLGEPGGRPPFGFVRQGRPPQLRPNDDLVPVRKAVSQAGRGDTDRAIAAALGLPIDTVRGILTNLIYIGLFRDGSPAAVEPVIERATWDRVQALRTARNARGGRPSTRRVYALPMLRCAACDRRLVGDSGRYRHLDPCPEFAAARRVTAYRNRLVRSKGYSQPADLYEGWMIRALDATALSAWDLTQAATVMADEPRVDEVAQRRIERERSAALVRYARDRDTATLEREMARLDAALADVQRPPQQLPWSEVLAVLRDLPGMWRELDAAGRRQLAEVHIASVRALGARKMIVDFVDGVQTVVMVGAKGTEPTITVSRTPWSTAIEESA